MITAVKPGLGKGWDQKESGYLWGQTCTACGPRGPSADTRRSRARFAASAR